MEKSHCLLCYNYNVEAYRDLNHDHAKLENQLPTIFLVKKLLGLSDEFCENLLRTSGNPSCWGVSTCPSCTELVVEAKVIHKQLLHLEAQMRNLKARCAAKIVKNYQIATPIRNVRKLPRSCPVDKIRAEVFEGIKIGSSTTTSLVDLSNEDSPSAPDDIFSCASCTSQPSIPAVNRSTVIDNHQIQGIGGIRASTEVQKTLVLKPVTENRRTSFEDNSSSTPTPILILVASSALRGNNAGSQLPSTSSNKNNTTGLVGSKNNTQQQCADTTDHCYSKNLNENTTADLVRNKGISSSSEENKWEELLATCEDNSLSNLITTNSPRIEVYEEVISNPETDTDTTLAMDRGWDEDDCIDSQPTQTEKQNSLRKKEKHCLKCNAIFSNQQSYTAHMKLLHSGDFHCPLCADVFVSNDLLTKHKKTDHPHPPRSTRITCPDCHKKFRNSLTYENHKMLVHSSGTVTCNDCGEDFESGALLRNHLKVHAKDRLTTFMCEMCPKIYKSNRQLIIHQAKIHGSSLSEKFDSKYRCKVCKTLLAHKKSLRRHMQSAHPNEGDRKSFLCSACPYSSWTVFELRVHMKHVHEGVSRQPRKIRPCTEPDCNKSYSSNESLYRHLQLVHGHDLNIKTYRKECPHCERTLSSKNALLIHLNSKHGENHKVNKQIKKKKVADTKKRKLKEVPKQSKSKSTHSKSKSKPKISRDELSESENEISDSDSDFQMQSESDQD